LEELQNEVEVYYRVSEVMGKKLKNYELVEADAVILPEVGDLHWSNFSQAMNLIDEGKKDAREKFDDIRDVMPGLRKWFRIKKIPKRNTKWVSP
jgi:NTE family protein